MQLDLLDYPQDKNVLVLCPQYERTSVIDHAAAQSTKHYAAHYAASECSTPSSVQADALLDYVLSVLPFMFLQFCYFCYL